MIPYLIFWIVIQSPRYTYIPRLQNGWVVLQKHVSCLNVWWKLLCWCLGIGNIAKFLDLYEKLETNSKVSPHLTYLSENKIHGFDFDQNLANVIWFLIIFQIGNKLWNEFGRIITHCAKCGNMHPFLHPERNLNLQEIAIKIATRW